MTDSSKAFYVTSVSNGLILANQYNSKPSGVVASNRGDKGDDEKWIIEAGDQPNVVALKNASNGKYLRAEAGRNGGKAGTGDKQWWKISSDRVTAPGACSLSPVDYPNFYLNHFQGRAVPKGHVGMTVHMWQWEASYPQWFSWYMFDTNVSFDPLASGTDSKDTKQSDAKQPDTNLADFDAKSRALEERDSALSEKEKTRSKEWEERDSALSEKEKTRSTEWDNKMKDLQDLQAKSASEEEERTASYDRKLKDLQDREAALSRQEEEVKSSQDKSTQDKSTQDKSSDDNKSNDNEAQAKREADIQRKLDDLSSAEQKLASDRAALQKSQSDLAKKEKDIAQLQKDLESSKASQTPGPSTNGHTNTDKNAEQRLEKTQKDNASLEQRLAKLEDQLSKMAKSPEKSSEAKAQTNGTANTTKQSKTDAGSPGCGYKHYKPPRKLNRKLIGMVYE